MDADKLSEDRLKTHALVSPDKLPPDCNGATFSPDGKYRYTLWRAWNPFRPRVMFLMLNPSTATEHKNDPTVRRCIAFAQEWGFGSIVVCNIFAYRSTDPKVLPTLEDPEGPMNMETILAEAKKCEKVVCAWGVWGEVKNQGPKVLAMLVNNGIVPQAIARTKAGHPGHPLYQPSTAVPTPLV